MFKSMAVSRLPGIEYYYDMHFRNNKINQRIDKEKEKKMPPFPNSCLVYFRLNSNFHFYIKKWKLVLKWKTKIKSFLHNSLFPSLQMERLILFLNYYSSEKITKIRNEKVKGSKEKNKEKRKPKTLAL